MESGRTLQWLIRWVPLALLLGAVVYVYKGGQVVHQISSPKVEYNFQEPVKGHSLDTKHHVDFIDMLSFLPYKETPCTDVFPNNSAYYFPKNYLVEEQSFQKHLLSLEPGKVEGNSRNIRNEQVAYWKLASLPFVHTICEIGFNAGHSTLIWLMANEKAAVYSFDLGIHNYSRPMSEYLMKKFPRRLHVTWGDSTETVPEFHQENKAFKCDLLIVDGGHTEAIALADINNFATMASEVNLLIFDDYPAERGLAFRLAPAWEKSKRNGLVAELFRCKYPIRGFTIGRYL